jgi:aminopeptidase-like protein
VFSIAADPATPSSAGGQMHALAARLYPTCRSITGEGVRTTMDVLREYIPLQIREVPTGTPVLDWTVPKEWNIRDAFVANARGERVIDFQRHNLHVVQYSCPVRARMTLAELRPRLHTVPEQPDVIPYRTSYYTESWGFCLSERQLQAMPEDEYEVVIDSSLRNGHLTYGELFLPGALQQEVLFHAHTCHPSLANDNLSGIVVAAFLAAHLASAPRRYSYRFLLMPGTIGAVTWLALNRRSVHRICQGVVLTGIGDAGPFTYKRSRRGSALVDRAMRHLVERRSGGRVRDFEPYGYDERQYCSPAFNLPVGTLMRTPFGSYPQYHTSADDLTFIRPESLEEALGLLKSLVTIFETDRICRNLAPKGEPQLGRRGLYRSTGGSTPDARHMALLWVLNLSDGDHSLFDIAERSGLPYELVERAATELEGAGLLARPSTPGIQ